MHAERQTLHSIDWLRVGVISLVVAHHAAQAYGPTGGAWPVFEPERSALLGPFFSVNAAFFMGLFFLISGYFVPGSLARKGASRFARDRLIRLGIPLLIIGFAVMPPIFHAMGDGARSFIAYYIEVYIGEWQVNYGPLWFVFHLLVYGLVYAALAQVFPMLAREADPRAPGHRGLIVLTLIIAVLGGLARLEYPQDRWVNFLWVMPMEPAHLPQYVAMFVAGTVAGRRRGFEKLPVKAGRTWLWIGLAAALFWYTRQYLWDFAGFALVPGAVMGPLVPLWEALVCVGLSAGLVVIAREHWNRPQPWLAPLAGATYGVFILHVFVVVGLNMAFLGLPLPPFVKFLAVTALALLICFPAVMAARRIPSITRVL